MKFFIDHCISYKLNLVLTAIARKRNPDHRVVPLKDKFETSVSDVDWMPVLGAEGGWVAITKDPGICQIAHERAAWLDSRLTAFFLDGPGWGNLNIAEFSWRFIRWWPRIVEIAESCEQGQGFIVPADYTGRLRRVAIKRSEMIRF